jgi:hypothetical protein
MFRRPHRADPTVGRILGVVERAKADLVAAVPSPRGVPGRSLAEALTAFEDGLRRAIDELDGWRTDDDEIRRSCRSGIEESLTRAERLRLEAPALDYEALVTVVGDLIAPLEVFARAERMLGS